MKFLLATFYENPLLDYVDTPVNKNLILGHINKLPANPPGIENLTIVITGTINGKASGIAYPAEHFALIGMQIFDRNKRHMAHELAHLLGLDKLADDLHGVENRLRLMLHDENTLSDQTINIGNELRPDEVHRIRTTLPGGFVR